MNEMETFQTIAQGALDNEAGEKTPLKARDQPFKMICGMPS